MNSHGRHHETSGQKLRISVSASYALALLLCWVSAGGTVRKIADWDAIVYTQQWPQSFCYGWNREKGTFLPETCVLSRNVTTWTVHGLWPTLSGTELPNFCNDSLPFDEALIQDIEDEMRARWPSLEGPSLGFWAFEWSKHGTCAVTGHSSLFPSASSYFQMGLQLNTKLQMERTLVRSGVTPSNTVTYSLSQIRTALAAAYGETFLVECITDRVTKKQYLAQVELCYTRQMVLGCVPTVAILRSSHITTPATSVCIEDSPIHYPVIRHSENFSAGNMHQLVRRFAR